MFSKLIVLFQLVSFIFANNYIVQFQDQVSEREIYKHFQQIEFLSDVNIQVKNKNIPFQSQVFTIGDMKYYHGYFTDNEVKYIRNKKVVKYVELDQEMHTLEIQENAPWHLDRISHRELSDDYSFNFDDNYGENVTVYSIDTGVFLENDDFEGRARWGFNGIDNQNDDCNGHGTHTSSLAVGKKYGVAKHAKIVAVKVLDCEGSGSMSSVLSGISWTVKDHIARNISGKSVINMSLGGSKSVILNNAVNSAVKAGVVVVVAAGNESNDACNTSPAGANLVITVGATNIREKMAYFSNFGKCVDILAPGQEITASWNSKHGTKTISGSSMSAPLIAGIVAVILSRNENLIPKEVKKILVETATPNKISGFLHKTSNLIGYIQSESVEELFIQNLRENGIIYL